mmetsp:Transcript_51239/g.147946  ORF Transcript_51239/g.147946 Transcript_51239/m.147946 type:complete len:274 (-) Transcript_51239:1768-2589(-)
MISTSACAAKAMMLAAVACPVSAWKSTISKLPNLHSRYASVEGTKAAPNWRSTPINICQGPSKAFVTSPFTSSETAMRSSCLAKASRVAFSTRASTPSGTQAVRTKGSSSLALAMTSAIEADGTSACGKVSVLNTTKRKSRKQTSKYSSSAFLTQQPKCASRPMMQRQTPPKLCTKASIIASATPAKSSCSPMAALAAERAASCKASLTAELNTSALDPLAMERMSDCELWLVPWYKMSATGPKVASRYVGPVRCRRKPRSTPFPITQFHAPP